MADSAKKRFDKTRKAVARLHDVQLMIMNGCDDWRPPDVKAKSRVSDPTAQRAIRNVDVLEAKLATLRTEESELIELIGETLVIIRAVRDGLGDKYADVLELRYIDCASWAQVKDEMDITRPTGYSYINIACDWVDSLGLTRILAGDLEI